MATTESGGSPDCLNYVGWCKNEGVCKLVNNSPLCVCADGYIGNRCEDQDHHEVAIIVSVVVVVVVIAAAAIFMVWWCRREAKQPPKPNPDLDPEATDLPSQSMELESAGHI